MSRETWNASLSNFDKPGPRYRYGDKMLNALKFKASIVARITLEGAMELRAGSCARDLKRRMISESGNPI